MDKQEIEHLRRKLPKIPGINGREDYMNSAVLVLLVKHEDGYHFLFQKRNPYIRQGGEICFPGGRYDEQTDTDMRSAALRETMEEIGLTSQHITIIGPLDIVIAPMGAIVEPFLGVMEERSLDKIKINENEVEKVFTLPAAFFKEQQPETYKTQIKVHPSYINNKGEEIILFPSKQLGLGEKYQNPWGTSENTVYVYKTTEGIIWGLTAKIVYDVVKKIAF